MLGRFEIIVVRAVLSLILFVCWPVSAQTPPAQTKAKKTPSGQTSAKKTSPAQTPTNQTPPGQTPANQTPTAQTTSKMCTVSGTVKDTSGALLSGGVVKIFDQDALHQAAAGIGDKGQFQLPQIPCGNKYTVQAESTDYQLLLYKDLPIHDPHTTMDLVLYHKISLLDQGVITGFLVLFYLLSIFFFRWHNIAIFDQKLLKAEVDATKARLEIESDTGPEAQKKLSALRKMLDEARKPFEKFSFLSWMFWTRGDEISSWTRLREVQRQMVSLWPLDSVERLRARLETVEQDLRTAKQPATLVIADALKDALTKAPDVDRWKQLLGEALGLLYSTREEDFQRLTTWQSKSTWLALIGCILIWASVGAKGGAMLMLMGAAGGLMSRLMRALRANDEPADYGASWTTLFLSPLLGALSAWYGVLLVDGFTSLAILNPALKISLEDQMSAATLALAFLLGFSERLFDSLVTAAEQRVLKQDQSSSQTSDTPGNRGRDGGARTSIKEIKPSNQKPGKAVVIFGALLDQANVEGIKLTSDETHQEFRPAINQQDATSITFNIPQDADDGKYTVTVIAKNSANVATSLQVGENKKPPTTIAQPSDSFKAGEKAFFSGTSLEQASIKKVEIHDAQGNVSVPANIQYAPKAISFTAPSEAGEYTLVVTPATGDALQQKFRVTQAAH